MDVHVEEKGATRRKLTVEVPAEVVRKEFDQALARVGKRASVPGFRAGKVPRSMLEKMYGAEVRADVLSHLIEHTCSDAIREKELRPISPPEIVPESIEKDAPLRYSATFDVAPEIELGQVEGIEVTRRVAPVTDEHVDQTIERIRQSLASYEPIEDRKSLEPGDFAAVEMRVTPEGDEKTGEPQARLVEVGAEKLPPEVEEALAGMEVDDEKSVEVTVPDDHPDESMRGSKLEFEIKLTGLRRRIVPEVDDDLAREQGAFDSLEELRADVRRRLEETEAENARDRLRESLIDTLLERHPFEAPPSLVERQVRSLATDAAWRHGIPPEELEKNAEGWEKLTAELRPQADKQVRATLLLDLVAEKAGIDVTEADVAARIEEHVAEAGEQAERMRALYAQEDARDGLRYRLARDRTFAWLEEHARITDETA